ncbi:unnamed protein product [Caenorhabditis bovis]|uniref:VWFA domain-containing protein n=1 Tax=Caenorhabditis bovis TaxID=2654633 RepID=A0A8S1ESI0_9PELO|nr:unnamed protein product [Caenorhabditis bovis]
MGRLNAILFWAIVTQLPSETIEEAPPSLVQFSQNVLRDFEHQSKFSLVQEEYEKLKSSIRSRRENAAEKLREAEIYLDDLFTKRVDALKKIVASAEASANAFEEYNDMAHSVAQNEARCEVYMKKMNDSDVHYVSNFVDGHTKSGTHITIESYQCDPNVMRDYDWTGTKHLENVMTENKKESPEMGHQYIGTYSGLTRMYPRRSWKVEPSPITIDLFDPRFRPWFVNAESVPKDVVFLIDYSGSVKGPTMHLIKITMMYILSTLNPNDYFFGVYFNSHFNPIVNCLNRTFLPATTSNKKVFFEELGLLEEKDQAHFAQPLKFSLDVLRGNLESNHSIFSGYRSEGHKLLIIFTDGVDEWPHQVLDEEFQTRNNELIRIFGFSMGYGTNQLPLQKYMACKSSGGYSEIDSIMDVKPQSRMFLNVLSSVRGETLRTVPVEKRQPSWTQLYMEAQGLGPTITLSMPILASDHSIWGQQKIAGIAAIDISIRELTNSLPLTSEDMYAYIVDNNGVLVYHPSLNIPKTEVHCVRRSACYDASQVKMKAGSGLRVQYGFSDERVYRLVGLIDSIPTIDMYDLEADLTAVKDLRRRITTKTCHEEPIKEGSKEYYCANLKNSPYTIVVVLDKNLSSLHYDDDIEEIPIINNKLVTFLYPRRDVCDWKLDSYSVVDRYAAWAHLSQTDACSKHDMRLARALSNGMTKWAQAWPYSDVEIPCTKTLLPRNASALHYVNTFIHTRKKIAAFYPACSISNMKQIVKKFDNEVQEMDNYDFLQFSMRAGNLFMYRTIADYNNNRLAVVGTQWRENYLDEYFTNFTSKHDDWNICKKQECSLITRNGHVVASSSTRRVAHLSKFDPQLFESLVKGNLVAVNTWVDVQAECMAKRTAPWSSPAPGPSNLLRHSVQFLFETFKMSFWKNLFESLALFVDAQPSMTGKTCTFQRIKPFERCSVKHFHYRMTLNITKQLQLVGMSTCSRYAMLYPVPNTALSLIIADRACSMYKPKKRYESDQKKLEKCDVIHSNPRRPPPILDDWKIHRQESYVDCETEISLSKRSTFYITISIYLLLLCIIY